MLTLFSFVNKQNNLGGSLHGIHVLLNAFHAYFIYVICLHYSRTKKYILHECMIESVTLELLCYHLYNNSCN